MNSAASLSAQPSAFAVLPVRAVILLLLWGIFFIQFPPLIALGILLGAFLVAYHTATAGQFDKINLLIILNIMFWLYSGLLTGALTVSTLMAPSYYTNEGRIFVTYLPFVILSSCLIGRGTLRMAVRQVALMAVIGLLLYFIWVVLRPAILSVGRSHNFGGLLTSHTGSGTFFAELCIFLTIYGRKVRSKGHVLLGFSMLLPVLGSASRESLVALAVVLAWYLRRAISLKTVLISALLIAGFVGVMPAIAPHTYDRTAQLFELRTLQDVGAQVAATETSNWEPGQDKNLTGEEFNVLSRVLYWDYAVKRFLDSPFLGAGFGRFNDHFVHFSGIPGLYYFGTSGQNNPATLHAHNSYLQMLAETGLVGLGLLLMVWYLLWRRMKRAQHEYESLPEIAGFFQALQGLIVFLAIAALFGHALGAPIDGIPVLTLLGLGAGFYRNHRLLIESHLPSVESNEAGTQAQTHE